jgi:hypothetical protein
VLNTEIEKVVEASRILLENELNLLVEVIFFIYNVNNALKGSSEEIPTEKLVLGIPPSMEPIFSFESGQFESDRLDYYSNQAKACITELPTWLKSNSYLTQRNKRNSR